MASLPDPLGDNFWKRDNFDWADEMDDMIEGAVESSTVTSVETENEYNDMTTEATVSPEPEEPPTIGHQRVATSPKFEYICDDICDDIDEDLIPMPLTTTTLTNTSESFAQTVDTDERYDEYLESLSSSVAWEFNWRNDTMEGEPQVHHFNWLGQGIFKRSRTLPEESLAVILSDPKAPQVTGDLRVESLLRNAYAYVDPLIVCLDEEVQQSLWNLRGSELQRAVSGNCFKYYTPHGRWRYDPEESMEQNSLDAGGINNYLNPNVVIGNGFVSNGLFPSRLDYKNRLQEKIESAPCLSQSSLLRKKRNPSPLHQSESATPLEIQTSSTSVVTQPALTPTSIATPTPSYSADHTRPALSPPTGAKDEPEIDTCEAGPSCFTATRTRLVPKRPMTINVLNLNANKSTPLDPSRDPDSYYSFPMSPFRYQDNKCKRIFKKLKGYIKKKAHKIQGAF